MWPCLFDSWRNSTPFCLQAKVSTWVWHSLFCFLKALKCCCVGNTAFIWEQYRWRLTAPHPPPFPDSSLQFTQCVLDHLCIASSLLDSGYIVAEVSLLLNTRRFLAYPLWSLFVFNLSGTARHPLKLDLELHFATGKVASSDNRLVLKRLWLHVSRS